MKPIFRGIRETRSGLAEIKASLADAIVSTVRECNLTGTSVERITGFAAADLSRIRNGHLDRFSVDRLMGLLIGLGQSVQVTVLPTHHASGATGKCGGPIANVDIASAA